MLDVYYRATQDEIELAIEGTRKALGEQIASLEKELDVLSERNAKLICKAPCYAVGKDQLV